MASPSVTQWKTLRHPDYWGALLGIQVIDPDGWRFEYNNLQPQDYDMPINLREFLLRVTPSTCQFKNIELLGLISSLVYELTEKNKDV